MLDFPQLLIVTYLYFRNGHQFTTVGTVEIWYPCIENFPLIVLSSVSNLWMYGQNCNIDFYLKNNQVFPKYRTT